MCFSLNNPPKKHNYVTTMLKLVFSILLQHQTLDGQGNSRNILEKLGELDLTVITKANLLS